MKMKIFLVLFFIISITSFAQAFEVRREQWTSKIRNPSTGEEALLYDDSRVTSWTGFPLQPGEKMRRDGKEFMWTEVAPQTPQAEPAQKEQQVTKPALPPASPPPQQNQIRQAKIRPVVPKTPIRRAEPPPPSRAKKHQPFLGSDGMIHYQKMVMNLPPGAKLGGELFLGEDGMVHYREPGGGREFRFRPASQQ